ncbi:hypothetical protein RJ639_017079 [Escallonia herrerae]|uniref:DUF3475 domain-containing protein n=1 Tax=Escallonia herrerae TaxID=1293975 RepID=A0AA89AMK7_9ASTE|nr:hypothetical protein RJ639_017079 [Escallonia herrerae]
MGGICSKGSAAHAESSRVGVNPYGSGVGGYWPRESGQPNSQSKSSSPRTRKSMEKQLHDEMQIDEPVLFGEVGMTGYESNEEDFYDGIPRFSRDLSQKSRSARFKQGSEVTSRLGRAGTLGLEKAVEVLDTLGSSMSNLNSGGGFVSGPTTKGNELSILAFEVANTIVKGYSLMQSLSKRSIRQLKEKVLPSEGVQLLVSKDTDELLRIVAADKREELKIFSVEVIRFGNRCKDPQWHNLDRYFEKHSREPPKLLKEEADLVTQQLMTLVQYTAVDDVKVGKPDMRWACLEVGVGPKESLKSYACFEAEKLLIDDLDSRVTSVAMARGVCPGLSLRFLHNKRSLEDMTDLLDKVEKYLGAEEDSVFHQEEVYTGRKRRERLESRALGGYIQSLSRPVALPTSTFVTKSKAKTSSSGPNQ